MHFFGINLIFEIGTLYMNHSQRLEKIAQAIHANDARAEAYLFGSRAHGNPKPDSDWDILILVDESSITNEIEDKFRKDLYEIELEAGQVVSTFVYPKDYWKNTLIHSPFYMNIKKDGVRL